MTAKRKPIGELPFWPLYLSREEAARYVGVSPGLFDAEVAAGIWPQPATRGAGERRLTWYRPALEAAAAKRDGTQGEENVEEFEAWRQQWQTRRPARRQGRAKDARGRD